MLGRIENIYYSLKVSIKSLYEWFPIIWKDRQGDHTFIFKILRHKLHLTEQYTRHHGHYVGNIKNADRIKLCVLLLDRLIKGEYEDHALDLHYEKWGTPKFIFKTLEERQGYSELIIEHENVGSEEEKIRERKEISDLMKHAGNQKVQDMDYLCEIIKKHVWSWWD